jgi:hypothetical protein
MTVSTVLSTPITIFRPRSILARNPSPEPMSSPELTPPPERSPSLVPLSTVTLHMHVRKGKSEWANSFLQETIDLNMPFDDIHDKFTEYARRKLKTNSRTCTFIFATRWGVLNTRAASGGRKPKDPVNPDHYADFDVATCLTALVQAIRSSISTKRGTTNHMLFVLATLEDSLESRTTESQEVQEREVYSSIITC